jgi:dimethylhistidine N-methyltransferase
MPTRATAPALEADFATEVRLGLGRSGQKELPSRYLYDEVGSALFEVICRLPEYGLWRAGARLLRAHAGDLVRRLRPPTIIAELGSGSGRNTRYLLEALSSRQRTTYYPIDVSKSALLQCARELSAIDSLTVVGFEQAYLDGLFEAAARRRKSDQLLVLFLGSTIGNLDRPAGVEFLRQIRQMLHPDDCVLLATDLMKPVPLLLRAYDDSIGVTAAFNLNLLARINRELGAGFELSRFRHVARWDDGERRIEMHLCSNVDQEIDVGTAGVRIRLRARETIWTESSHKYTLEEVREIATRTGYQCETQWVDTEWPFAQSLFRAA